ncbi:MAG: D-alanine--D-alanine ligase [Aestuariivirgaceae bacterium]|nr:D-alanine--D-alanine ligase [Aestuariivirgaceae bacterium]
MKHVAVLMGGWSAEREVSLSSGRACAAALERAGYKVTSMDVDRDVYETLKALKPDAVFNALHGKWGEDGCVQAILETLRIAYTHSGVLSSALAMHKEKSKAVFRQAGLPVAESRLVALEEAAAAHPMSLPYVLKPVAEGSSVGVHIVLEGANGPVSQILNERHIFGDEVMVERFVPGQELTCAVMKDEALGVIDIVPTSGFYDYDAKYVPGGSRHILPAPIPAQVYGRVREITVAAHKALGCRGVSRSDFRYDPKSGDLILLEVNTQPGMTGTSLVPELAAHAGHSLEALVSWMVEDASLDR